MYLGSFGIDDYVGIPAATHRFSSGAAYAPTSLTYSIYEEATTTGIDEDVDMTPASPFDSIVGCYWIRRQLTTAAGFEAGKNYMVVVKATVDSVAAIQMHTFQVAAKVDALIADALGTDTIPELSQGQPSATPTVKTALMLLYMSLRNQLTTDATSKKIFNDAGTCITKKALSDNATTYTEAKAVTGP